MQRSRPALGLYLRGGLVQRQLLHHVIEHGPGAVVVAIVRGTAGKRDRRDIEDPATLVGAEVNDVGLAAVAQ